MNPAKKHRSEDRPKPRPLAVPRGENLEVADNEKPPEESLDPSDPRFQSELTYEGYRSLEESDNDSFNSLDLERNDDPARELIIQDREEDPDSPEEDPVDPQENRK